MANGDTLLAPDSLLQDAQFSINYEKKKIIEKKIRFDFTQDPYDEQELNFHIRELAIAENHLKVLLERLDIQPEVASAPKIVRWALGE